ncbi:MAG: DNA polymerase III subunit alpha [Erysipelotrichaceae bacterium]|nr:DNA polymerase III subunit alpha [Erysipelotrichaceae bacterium]
MATHLALRSSYSLLESTLTIKDIVSLLKDNGFKCAALCDHRVMYASVSFYKECIKNGIKPIIGLEVDIRHEDYESSVYLLAKNNQGYRNLLSCSSFLNCEATYLTVEQLLHFSNDCVMILPSEGGMLEPELIKEDQSKLITTLNFFREHHSDFYIGLSSALNSLWRSKNTFLKTICHSLNIKTVMLNKIYYQKPEDFMVLKTLRAIKKSTNIDDQALLNERNYQFLDTESLMPLYQQDDIDESDNIAELCNINIFDHKSSLPIYKKNVSASSKDYLFELCKVGLKKRFENKKIPISYQKRLNFELSVIFKMNYEDYFLIVWDFIRYARNNGIYVGPGRGSAAGSVVSWSLGITHVDPIFYGLLFERFLNPERISLPDIDIDFPDNRRDEVIKYVAKLYGKDHVAHIATFGTFGAKQAIRDCGRVMNLNTRELDLLAKSIPNGLNISLDTAYNNSKKFKQIVDSDERFIQVYKMAIMIEGLPRHISTHAAGVVMSKEKLTDVVALISVEPDMLSTQVTMEYLEELGLIKMDFLGLRNLTIIDKTLSYIKPKPDIFKIPLDDQKTYEMISKGDTVGIFQLESEGMKNLIVKMRPNQFTDISTCIALFRPGPMENIPLYLKNRQDPSVVSYLHKDLIPILNETYGVIIYQEQIMQIAQVVAGFSLSKADILRKAMSKKSVEQLTRLKEEFILGCINKGHSQNVGKELYDLILKFANYGFNKSHSVAYALIAYQMAYLKANYPEYFMSCLLDSVIGSEVKTAEYLNECRKCNVFIKPISINHSNENYTFEDGAIRLPFVCIKGVGLSAVKEILSERERGLFSDYHEFVARINMRKISKSIIESLIKAGALDEFDISRNSMLKSLDNAINYANLVKIDNPDQNYIDFGLIAKPIILDIADTMMEKLQYEKETMGLYISEHPMITVKRNINYQGRNINDLKITNERVSLLVNIVKVKHYQAKTGEMAFVSADDESGMLDLVVLPNQYRKFSNLLVKNKIVLIEGKMDKPQSFVVDMISDIEL